MKLLIIPSDNGLGHIRRSIILANHLCKKIEITLLLNKKIKSKFKINNKIKIIFIDKIFKIIKKKYFFYNKKKINRIINKYKYVWVDNFADLFNLNQKSFLYYNFLWHKILKLNNRKYKKIDNNIKESNSFGNYLFQKKYFNNEKNKLIPFYEKFNLFKNKKAVLISVGTSDYKGTKSVKNSLKKYFQKYKVKKIKFYIDPIIYDESFKKMGFKQADFSKKMYSKIKFAIIKPGLGTVEECLKRGIIIISHIKGTNSEFSFNSKILLKNKLGYNFQNIDKSLNFIFKNFDNNKIIKQHENNCKNLKWEGEKLIGKYLSNFN